MQIVIFKRVFNQLNLGNLLVSRQCRLLFPIQVLQSSSGRYIDEILEDALEDEGEDSSGRPIDQKPEDAMDSSGRSIDQMLEDALENAGKSFMNILVAHCGCIKVSHTHYTVTYTCILSYR